MAQIAEKHLSQLERIKKNVEDSNQYFNRNIERYHEMRKFVLETSITNSDEDKLKELEKPIIEFNEGEAYISRLRGEFSKQIPSISVRGTSNLKFPNLPLIIEGHIRSIFQEANKNQFQNNIYMDTMTGGFSVMKVWLEYEHEYTFNKVIRVGRVYDPTLCGFDPLATEPHKGDGEYCFELYPMTKESFKRDYPSVDLSNISFSRVLGGFSWYYNANNSDILMISRYYEKKYKNFTLFRLSNGIEISSDSYENMVSNWNSIEQIPEIIDRRTSRLVKIMCYKFIGDELLEKPIEMDGDELPLIFVDGNSATLKDNNNSSSYQFTRPYLYHMVGAQKFKNYLGQTFANEVENMEQHKWLVEKESIPENYAEIWSHPQLPGILVYNGRDKDGEALPRPEAIARTPIPPEIYGAFNSIDSTIQNILGSYDASLGINNNQLSGVAIVEGATQSNATAMPYVMNFMASLNQMATLIMSLIPDIYNKRRTISIIDNNGKESQIEIGEGTDYPMDYNRRDLEVVTEASVNFKIEKNRAIEQLAKLSQAFPTFQQFINEKGLPFIMSNLDMRGIEELRAEADEFKTQQDKIRKEIEQSQMNPQSQLNPAQMMDLKLKAHKQQLEEQKAQQDNQYRAMEIALENKKLNNQERKMDIDAQESLVSSHVQLTKAETEKQSKAAELAMKEISNLREHQLSLQKAIHQLFPGRE